jgi:hypothetical protein
MLWEFGLSVRLKMLKEPIHATGRAPPQKKKMAHGTTGN